MKKRLFLLSFVFMLMSIFSFTYAEDVNNYEYEIQEDGTLIITDFYRWYSSYLANPSAHTPTLVIPEEIDGMQVTAIGPDAFENCSLELITIPHGITTIYGNPFRDSSKLAFDVPKDHPTLALIDGVLFSKPDKRLICFPKTKDSIKNYTVPEGIQIIGDHAFYGSSLSTITLPSSLVSIGTESFMYCDKISKVSIPDSVTTIGDFAFSYCDQLREINIPMSLTSIGVNPFRSTKVSPSVPKNHPVFNSVDGALYNKKENKLIAFPLGAYITEFTVAKGTKSIGDYALYSVGYLKQVILPDGLIEIGDYAFAKCATLNNVSIPKTVKTLGNYAFAYCEDIESIIIPDGVTYIPDGLFYECSLLGNITLPKNITAIGNKAFTNCWCIKEISIPQTVESIGDEAFAKCERIKSITLPKNLKYLGKGAFAYSGLKTIELPTSILVIADSLFSGCENFESIKIPHGITEINSNAFANCPLLQSVDIPGTVQKIADDAFEKSNNVALIVESGSYAEEYAKEQQMDYSCPGDNDWLFQ